jgi:CRISPR-associated protein Csm2
MAEFKETFKNQWISERLDPSAILYAEKLGEYLKGEKFSTSQIRNVYGEVKRIEQRGIKNPDSYSSFLLLKPKLAYAAKRAKENSAGTFKNELNKAINVVLEDTNTIESRFRNFCQLFEAILAYHKAFGGN